MKPTPTTALGRLCRVRDGARIGRAGAAGLFHEDMQAALQCRDREVAVLHRAGSHAGDVDVRQREQLGEVRRHMLHAVAAGHFFSGAAVDVAHTDEFDVVAHQLRQQHRFRMPPAAGPDHAAGHVLPPFKAMRFLMNAHEAESSACSSRDGGFHCANGMPMRSSVRRNGSRQIAPA